MTLNQRPEREGTSARNQRTKSLPVGGNYRSKGTKAATKPSCSEKTWVTQVWYSRAGAIGRVRLERWAAARCRRHWRL